MRQLYPKPSSRVNRTQYYFEHRANSILKKQISSHRNSSKPTPNPAHIAAQHVEICLASLLNASNGLPPPDEFCVFGSGDAAGALLVDELAELVLDTPSDCWNGIDVFGAVVGSGVLDVSSRVVVTLDLEDDVVDVDEGRTTVNVSTVLLEVVLVLVRATLVPVEKGVGLALLKLDPDEASGELPGQRSSTRFASSTWPSTVPASTSASLQAEMRVY